MTSFQTPTGSLAKTGKWPTHLAITGDLVLGLAQSDNYVHNIEATVYDIDDCPHPATLNIWARDVPEQGAYLVTSVPVATSPTIMAISDAITLRRVPEEIDGGNLTGPSLDAVPPMFTGIGVIRSVEADRKSGTVVGLTYLNKAMGWKEWRVNLMFEGSIRFQPWFMPPPPTRRHLVSFDAILSRGGADGDMEMLIRRMTSLGMAPPVLQQALEVSGPAGNDRAARLREARQQAAKRPRISEPDAPHAVDPDAPVVPPAPKAARTGTPLATPGSPSPAPGLRKRGQD